MSDFIFLRAKTEAAKQEFLDKNKKNAEVEITTDDAAEINSAFEKISGFNQKYQEDDDSLFNFDCESDYTIGEDNDNNLFG